MSIQTSPSGGSFLGRYRPVSYLGSGGMADVFKCELQGIGGFGKLCVVKRMKPELLSDEGFIAMFLDEARLVARLNHQNVVQVFEIDQANGVPFIAMELIRGPTLSKLLRQARKSGGVPIGLAVRVIADAALGLAAAHDAVDEKGAALHIVHRDISPQNLMVSADGITKVLDFGVAKADGKLARTATGTLKGKVAYMAPEQILGHALDGRADVYALGICLYQAVTSRMPFPGNNDVEVLRARLAGDWASALSVRPDLPAELDGIITDALAADPTDRTPSALALHDRLESFLKTWPEPSDRKGVAAWVMSTFPSIDDLVAGTAITDVGLAAMSALASADGAAGGLTPRSQPSSAGSASREPTAPTGQLESIGEPISIVSSVVPLPVTQANPVRRAALIAGAVGSLGALVVVGLSALLVSMQDDGAPAVAAPAPTVAAPAPTVAAPELAAPPGDTLTLDDLGAPPPPPAVPSPVRTPAPAPAKPAGPRPASSSAAQALASASAQASSVPAPVEAPVVSEPAPPAPEPPPAVPAPGAVAVASPPPPPPMKTPPPVTQPAPPELPAAEAPGLPAKQRVYAVAELIAACKKLEAELKTRGHLPATMVDNVTAPLAKELVSRVARGDAVDVPLVAAYWYVAREARAGRSRSAIAAGLAQAAVAGSLR